jgi:hypothetical protein
MDNSRIQDKVLDEKFHGRETCEKTTTGRGQQYQDGLLLLLNVRGWRRLDLNSSRGQYPVQVVVPLKK